MMSNDVNLKKKTTKHCKDMKDTRGYADLKPEFDETSLKQNYINQSKTLDARKVVFNL